MNVILNRTLDYRIASRSLYCKNIIFKVLASQIVYHSSYRHFEILPCYYVIRWCVELHKNRNISAKEEDVAMTFITWFSRQLQTLSDISQFYGAH